jgi:hypothetical protein
MGLKVKYPVVKPVRALLGLSLQSLSFSSYVIVFIISLILSPKPLSTITNDIKKLVGADSVGKIVYVRTTSGLKAKTGDRGDKDVSAKSDRKKWLTGKKPRMKLQLESKGHLKTIKEREYKKKPTRRSM